MKIGKKFSMTISGKYQSYTFSTVVEAEGVEPSEIEVMEYALARTARAGTFKDIETLAGTDEEFQLVLADRREELQNYKKVLDAREQTAKHAPIKRKVRD